jgi:hypothetical protein
MAVEKGIAYENTHGIHLEDGLFFQNNASYTIDCCWDSLERELANVFVTVRTEHTALIFVHAEIELSTMLYY